MGAVVFIVFVFFGLWLVALPTYFFWVSQSGIPIKYPWSLPGVLTTLCVLLSFVTGYVFSIELESGILSGFMMVLFLSFIWALLVWVLLHIVNEVRWLFSDK